MEIYVVIAGCRTYSNYEEAKDFIISCLIEYKTIDQITILSGGCQGADLLGERFAKENSFPIKRYLPDWKKYGKAAGPIRNKQMVDVCHKVICFWDGKSKGTESLIKYAKKSEKKVDIKLINQSP